MKNKKNNKSLSRNGILGHGMGGMCRAARIIEGLERKAGRNPDGFDVMERIMRKINGLQRM